MKTHVSRLLNEALAKAAKLAENRLTAAQVVAAVNAVQARLVESESTSKNTPLEQEFVQYIKRGNSLSPVGKVELVDKLGNCPYEVQCTMNGVIFERVKPNTDEIMVFENSPVNMVVKEIDKFWNCKEAYDKLGLMHNRGILMYGPPGTGKSIGFQQVTEMMAGRGDVVFFVKSPEAILEGMKAFRQIEPTRKVVIGFEEADEMCRYNERTMLRLMDGDAKINGVLFLATTNYLDKLPERMLRPGRFDKIVEVKPPTYAMRLQYLTKKLAGIEENQAKVVELARQSEGFGFGHLRELVAGIYAIGDSMPDTMARLRKRRTSYSSDDSECKLTSPIY